MFFRFPAFFLILLWIGVFSIQANAQSGAQSGPQGNTMLAAAIAATDKQDWPTALALAGRVNDPIAGDIIRWIHLRKGADLWRDYTNFLARHPNWPGLAILRIRGESSIPPRSDPAAVLAYFKPQRPQTGAGILRLTEAYTALGKTKAARAEAERAWRSFSMKKDDSDLLLSRFSKALRKFHVTRLDMLLWRGKTGQARAMLPLVPKSYAALARARIGLRQRVRGVSALIRAVPKKLRNDPGLAYERFLWRLKKGLGDSARTLLISRSTSAKALGKPAKWASARRKIARQEMRDGNNARAYRIAAHHFLTKGPDYADLEWLSGYIALRKLHDPARALTHFKRFRSAVATPISYGRAGYWLGRTYDALGDKTAAKAAYSFAARYQTSFYGQLAAQRIGAAPDPALTGRTSVPDWRRAPFINDSRLRAALLLHYAGQPKLAEMFVRRVASGLDTTGTEQLAGLMLDIGRPDIAVRLAKRLARKGIVMPRFYFPLTPLAKTRVAVAPEVAMSIARRESELNPLTISPAGARGLMQIMPKTARKVARKIGVPYSRSKLTSDWKYNARLASAYLARQIADFGGSYILAFAAYNAGPSRARQWINLYGDPRRDSADQIDWIEHIPFRETRNYVMRVTESLFVYRARITGQVPKLHIIEDLKRG